MVRACPHSNHFALLHTPKQDARVYDLCRLPPPGVSGPYPWMGGYNSGSLSNTYWIDGTPFDYNPGNWGIDDPKMHFYTGGGNWGTWCNTCTSGGICQTWGYQTTG